VVTATGVKVVLEAPVTFEFDSPQRLRLFRGRVAADVPPSGKGFTVVTPSGNAIDLGTSFGVAVGESGDTQVHVFEGEVIAESKEGTAKSVRCNEATSLSTPNAACDIRTGAFIRVAEMPALEAGFVSGQMVRGQEAMDRVRQDPSLVSLYDFDGRDMPSGQFTVVQGRWPGSRAVDFANAGDHMNVSIDEGRAWPQLTLAAWVRLDRLHDRNQSLYHADLWSEGAGHIHWMVSHLRTIRLAINGSVIAADAPERSGEPDSASAMNGALDRWIHVASVYDSESRTVRFFLNGLFDHESRLAVAPPAVLGRGQIGNWIGQERHLSGRIDELLVLGRALSDAEIADLHAATTPYR